MNNQSTQHGPTTSSRQSTEHPFIRGFLDGTAGLFDTLGVRARPLWRRTPEGDARNLQCDFQRIAQDLHAVLSKTGSDPVATQSKEESRSSSAINQPASTLRASSIQTME